MSRSAPTDAQLLDMAREVLAVCQDRSLRDIIEDLTITHSSEQTINRIFDGQFLKALAAEVAAAPSQDVVILLSSSEDDTSDQENLPGPRESTAHVGSSVMKGFDRSSPTPPFATSATRTLLFTDGDEPFKGRDTLEIKQLRLNIGDEEQKETSLRKRRPFLMCVDEPLLKEIQNQPTQADEPLVIDVLHTPTRRPRTTGSAFKVVSPVDNDAFEDWNYELIPSPARGKHSSPTIVFSPPSKHSRNTQRTSEIRHNSSTGISRLASSPPGTPPRTDTSSELSGVRSIKPIKSITPRAQTRPSSHFGSNRSSHERSPSPRDLEPQTFIDLEDGPDLDWSSSQWKGDTGASDVEDREYLDKKARWDAIANASLSPPTLFQDDFSESDQELLDDVFGGLPTGRKKGLARSSSSKSLVPGRRRAQGKARALSASPELDGWSGDTPSGGALSVEQEIERRNRRKRGRKQDTASGDSDSADESSLSAAGRKRSSKGPKNEENEASRLAKEEQKRARDEKKAAQDWEKEQRQVLRQRAKFEKEEEKKAERDAARELRIANRLTSKSESAKEMIVCIEKSLHQSTFGQVMQDYLSSIECLVNVLPVAGSDGASTIQRGQAGKFDKGRTDEFCPAPNTLFWRRIVTSRYDDEQDVFMPIAKEEIQLESFLLLYQNADDFVQALEQKQFLSLLSELKRDLRLRKTKERLANIGKSSSTATLLKEEPRQRQRIILLIAGMEGYFRGLRKVATTRYRQRVLEQIDKEEGRSPTVPVQEESSTVDRNFIERELLRLQLEHDCLIIHSCDEEDSAQVITSLTEQIGLVPYVGTRKSELNISTEGVKSGTDPEDTWIKTLQAIHMVTHGVARSIAAEYPTIKSLYEGYRQCANTGEAQSMLEGIPIINRNNVLGKTLSRRIYDIFMSEDPMQAVS
ncbi:putative monocarboxylate transporter mch1 [Mortierella alpina]|uniref:Monocarboxylate transporter mch1 n=1 Tax=Mortierella alpina TaxID=64518 RepID=A0A9P6JGE3_MORAP|nr:putative monocarboxylate transporter mch1 [Mortierella alpina]